MSDEEYEEVEEPTTDSLQILDLVGIGLQTAAGVTAAVANGFALLSRELYSAARRKRLFEETERLRREQGFDLERLVEGDYDG